MDFLNIRGSSWCWCGFCIHVLGLRQGSAQARSVISQNGVQEFALLNYPLVGRQSNLVTQLGPPVLMTSTRNVSNKNHAARAIPLAPSSIALSKSTSTLSVETGFGTVMR